VGQSANQGANRLTYDAASRRDAAFASPLAAVPRPRNLLSGARAKAVSPETVELQIPSYLDAHYWWAYIHPRAVKLFERQWLANLILWGNYARLRDALFAELGDVLPGRTLQVACVYGDLTPGLCRLVGNGGGSLDVVDVLPIQLGNLRRKLPKRAPVSLLAMDSTNLDLPSESYDRAVVFFLLHEQPAHCRQQTLSELFRVVKPGGKIVVIDYALPRWWHPLRYVWRPLLATLEPFALDLWRDKITKWMPPIDARRVCRREFFGGLYQMIVIKR
jgi:ubiquinone/menaquinone biosynthesis C-methylase UbiE